MDEKDCELLLELKQSQNITKAAQKLFITQPALTKRIQKIEEELQCQLLLRTRKGVIFTPAGESILPYVTAIAENNRRIREQIDISRNEICGTIHLGSSLNFSHYRLPAILRKYKEKYPNVDIQITTGQSRHLFHMLKQDQISVAILRGAFTWPEGIQKISSEPMCLVCSRENQGRPLTDYPYIGRHTDTELSRQIESWLMAHGLSDIRSGLWIDNIDTCKEMARHGLGWCILPQICLDDFDGFIDPLTLPDGTPFVRNTYLLYKKIYSELPQIKLFFKELDA